MKNRFFLNRILMLFIFLGACHLIHAQSSSSTTYHWRKMKSGPPLTSATELEYKNLPQADYTPKQDISQWAAADDLRDFGATLSKTLSVLYILTVDESGFVRKMKVIKTSDRTKTDALSAKIINTKISGPSYTRNKAVTTYVPCSISLDKNQITIL